MNNSAKSLLPEKPWARSVEEILTHLNTSLDTGLGAKDVQRRRKAVGRNVLPQKQGRGPLAILVDQFRSLVIGLLVVAAAVSLAFGEIVEGVSIGIAVLINAAIGFFIEFKAVKSMNALRQLSSVTSIVRRDGHPREAPAEALVPGDVVIIEGGDMVTADLRLVEANKLQVDESPLTGESVPVGKRIEAIAAEAELAERSNMLYKGTSVTRGTGVGIVVATGPATEIGSISTMVQEAAEEATPLEKRLDRLGRSLIWVVLVLVALVAAIGIWRGKELLLMIESAVALAVAAVPEGLPVVATIALGRGMIRMARRNALINKLASVETLGATDVICTDKTGTLTENRMTVARYVFSERTIDVAWENGAGRFVADGREVSAEDDDVLHDALLIGLLCNNATRPHAAKQREELQGDIPSHGGLGDPMEVALLQVAASAGGMKRPEIARELVEEREEAFESETKMMATYHRDGDGWLVAVKGAPEPVLDGCAKQEAGGGETELSDTERERWAAINVAMAEEGLRVLALAKKRVMSLETAPYEDLVLIGLVGLSDPARAEVADAIRECQEAGIRVVMVTGDQPVTARRVAEDVGLMHDKGSEVLRGKELEEADEQMRGAKRDRLLAAPIFARVSPRQKLNLIALHQGNGSVVAMTGDGVNDAPALKKADIGIAMGQRGTQVARETADMILKDDSFATIVVAVEQGRVIFDNIRKFVLYLLSGNMAEIIAVAASSVANWPLPLLPLQILFLNFVIDVFPALALGVGEGDKQIMERPPRRSSEAILGGSQWLFIGVMGAVIAACGLGALGVALAVLGLPEERAVTVSFLAIAFGRLFHVLNMRDAKSGLLGNEVTRNGYVWAALAWCAVLIAGAVYMPGLSGVLGLVGPGVDGWLVAMVAAVIPVFLGQGLKEAGVLR